MSYPRSTAKQDRNKKQPDNHKKVIEANRDQSPYNKWRFQNQIYDKYVSPRHDDKAREPSPNVYKRESFKNILVYKNPNLTQNLHFKKGVVDKSQISASTLEKLFDKTDKSLLRGSKNPEVTSYTGSYSSKP